MGGFADFGKGLALGALSEAGEVVSDKERRDKFLKHKKKKKKNGDPNENVLAKLTALKEPVRLTGM
tara:strand:+ start:48 stop:245 length:198 start_codon:yes stop_codon:yes gene_type:complete